MKQVHKLVQALNTLHAASNVPFRFRALFAPHTPTSFVEQVYEIVNTYLESNADGGPYMDMSDVIDGTWAEIADASQPEPLRTPSIGVYARCATHNTPACLLCFPVNTDPILGWSETQHRFVHMHHTAPGTYIQVAADPLPTTAIDSNMHLQACLDDMDDLHGMCTCHIEVKYYDLGVQTAASL